jgi:3-hydroxyisobutyrate dehydrogenase-like beta-hydroxyacid dehydrogenase
MGLPMTGNLVKRGFEVKAFDINPDTVNKCKDIVNNHTLLIIYRELLELIL